MKKLNASKILAALEVAAIPMMMVVASCGSDQAAQNFVQIEQLARPGINELFVFKNASHEAFNSLHPSTHLTSGKSVIDNEVVPVLQAIDGLGGGASTPPIAQVASGFLPDVMRIDTNESALARGSTGYGNCLSSTNKILCGGRRIRDDVINISYSYLVTGNPAAGVDDGVVYQGDASSLDTDCDDTAEGTNPAAPGHRCLHGQTSRSGTASFPFLAKPN